jgi:predicted dehydrogenase
VLTDVEDVAFINMEYESGVTAHLHLSWLDPLKIRNTVVVGTKQMVVCDSGEKAIHIYNKRVDVDKRALESNKSYAAHLMSYKYGDVISPFIQGTEPMQTECQDFINAIDEGTTPVANGELGIEVVRTLEAMQKSILFNDIWTEVDR